MADTKISALPDGVTAELTDDIPINRALANFRITPAYIRALLLAHANTWTAQQTFADGTITANAPTTFTQTWNNGAVAFTGLFADFTDTASDAASLLMDLQVGGVSKFKVDKNGAITTAGGTLVSAMTDTWNNAGTTFDAIKMTVTNTASGAASSLLNLLIGATSQFRVAKDGRVISATGSLVAGLAMQGGTNAANYSELLGGAQFWINASNITAAANRGDPSFGSFAVTTAGVFGWGPSTTDANVTNRVTGLVSPAAGVVAVEAASAAGGTFSSVATSPAQITANQDNYNPGGVSNFQRWSTDASRNITGLTFTPTKQDGQRHVIVNVGAQNIVLKHQDAASTAANRFLNATGADITLAAEEIADVIYDSTTARWRAAKR